MLNKNFQSLLKKELQRIDDSQTSKRSEVKITGFKYFKSNSPKAIIGGKSYLVFNSNDYLGLRLNEEIIKSERETSKKYGAGPGAVRFISGTLKVYEELEKQVAKFHKRQSAMIFSSGFATNIGVIQALVKGASKDSLIQTKTLVVSDELNHRSIIDGIRTSGLSKEAKAIFKHKNPEDLDSLLKTNNQNYDRVIVITDGVFSMLGNYQDLKEINKVISKNKKNYSEGILLVVDDCHGVGCFGKTGRGVEEHTMSNADILVGTFGKAFGSDGGYVVGDKLLIDFLRESTATYIYSNPPSPGTAGAALKALKVLDSKKGKELLEKLNGNVEYFKKKINSTNFKLAVNSIHPIQPILVGDSKKTKRLVEHFFENNVLITNISYPIVPKGRDEIRVQLSSSHSKNDIDYFFDVLKSFKS